MDQVDKAIAVLEGRCQDCGRKGHNGNCEEISLERYYSILSSVTFLSTRSHDQNYSDDCLGLYMGKRLYLAKEDQADRAITVLEGRCPDCYRKVGHYVDCKSFDHTDMKLSNEYISTAFHNIQDGQIGFYKSEPIFLRPEMKR